MGLRSAPRGSRRGLAARTPAFIAHLAHGAWRGLRRDRGLVLAMVMTLAATSAGVGAVAMLSDRLLVRPLTGIADPERLERLFRSSQSRPDQRLQWSWSDAADIGAGLRDLFEATVPTADLEATLVAGVRVERVRARAVGGGYFELLGLGPELGRLLGPEDAGAPVAVLSAPGWRRWLDGDPEVVGRTFRLNGEAFTVVGVTSSGFSDTSLVDPADLFLPLDGYERVAAGPLAAFSGRHDRRQTWLDLLGRRRPGVSRQGLRSRLDLLSGQLDALPEHGDGLRLVALPLQQLALGVGNRGQVARYVAVLGAGTLLALLSACATLTGLQIGRTARRGRELGLRACLGERRSWLAADLVGEVVAMGLLGLLVGGLALSIALPWLRRLRLPVNADLGALGPSAASVGGALLLILLAAGGCGLLAATRTLTRSPSTLLRGGGGPRSRTTLRELLVVGQVALCFVAMVAAALAASTVRSLESIPLGFSPERLLAASLDVADRRWPVPRTLAFYRELGERARAMAGVEAAGLASALPMTGSQLVVRLTFEVLGPAGAPQGKNSEPPQAYHALIDPGYLATVGSRILAGRGFGAADTAASAPVLLVNESAARAYWPERSPIGAQVRLLQTERPFEVVGVVADARFHALQEPPSPTLFLDLAQAESSFLGAMLAPGMTVVLRGERAERLAPALRKAVQTLDGELPLFDVATVEQRLRRLVGAQRQAALLLQGAAALALALALLGLAALASQAVVERTREMGIRAACGASPTRLVVGVLARSAALGTGGITLGGVALLAARRGLEVVAGSQGPAGVGPWLPVALTVLAVCLLAALPPALRARRVDVARVLSGD